MDLLLTSSRATFVSRQGHTSFQNKRQLTLDLSDGTNKDILLGLLVADALKDIIDDRLNELSLLALFGLLFETDPAVKDGLDLGSECNFLLLDKSLVLETGSFL